MVQAYRLASDERLNQAAVPSLVIAAIGLLPVLLVCRGIAGQGASGRCLTPAGRARLGGVTPLKTDLVGRSGWAQVGSRRAG